MTNDGLREPVRVVAAMDGRDGHGDVRGRGPRSGDGPTTVTVMPLWVRFRTGARR
ncbi:hypothetical protein SAMN04487980_1014176 [Streptomyces sp. cf124]|uniref:hypothetical protein n=1 Tax=Streptomyces sp. cf124 TaxID=1761903 RepID=UPI0008EBD572|nr:hypothetical protein [Streptomyces sp. cf124]SFN24429.1 hypothetical protein SAMN04487980_1014176 [Streptomyces sp. cf124]